MRGLERILKEIDARVEEYKEDPAEYVDVCAGLREAERIIRKHMNGGWIPVEKCLPEEIKEVLIFTEYGFMYIGIYYKGIWRKSFPILDIVTDVVAWRPLPEPYRPERRVGE